MAARKFARLGYGSQAIASISLAILAPLQGAWAQVPSTVAPGRIERQFEQAPVPRANEAPAAPQVPGGTEAPAGAETVQFLLRGVKIDGVTVYEPDEFGPLYAELLDHTVTLARIFELAQAITVRYRNDGYILSQAVVPAQRIEDGVVHLQVIEGFIDRVLIEGADPTQAGLIASMGDHIREVRPLTATALERYLLLMNDLPGVSAKSFLQPSPTVPGAADLSIVVEEKPVDAYISLDNRGSRFVGPLEVMAASSLNDALGLYERTTLRYSGSQQLRQLQYFEVDHQEQLGDDGLKLDLTALSSHSEPGGFLTANRTETQDYSASATLSYPIVRSRSENLNVHGKVDVNDVATRQQINPLLPVIVRQEVSDDKLRAMRAGGSYDFVDTWLLNQPATNLISGEFSHGLNTLGAIRTGSPLASRGGGSADFTKVTMDISRQQTVTEHWGVLLAGTGQYAANRLLSEEEFGFGGANFGRGYDGSQILGDNGIAVKVELQYNDCVGLPGLDAYQPYIFYDAGATESRAGGESQAKRASSTGVGVRVNSTSWLTGFVEVARQLTPAVATPGEGKEATRFYIGAVARY